jgi:PIN like domain
LKFFFDNNLSRHLAHGIRELSAITPVVEKIIHLTDCFEKNAPDLKWIGELSRDGPWYIISIDRFKKQHGAEREAIRRAGHTVFVLDSQWSKHGFWMQTERLVRWWPQIVDYSDRVSGGAYRVPWQHSSGAKFQAISF